jgi:hypothetical protein
LFISLSLRVLSVLFFQIFQDTEMPKRVQWMLLFMVLTVYGSPPPPNTTTILVRVGQRFKYTSWRPFSVLEWGLRRQV